MTHILIVEDSPTQAQHLRFILESEQFHVTHAVSGEEALRILSGKPHPDLVISDIVMSGITGYELCTQLKSNRATRDLPIILLTSLADPLDIIQGLESGADNFITKPYDAAYLTSRVRMILENKRLRQTGKLNVGVEILFLGRKFTITSDKEQILDLLISTFEDIVRSNRQLEQSRAALAEAKVKLQEYAVALEGRVRASQERYRALLETAPDPIVTITSDNTIEVANSQTAQTFEYREADLEDMPLERLFPRKDANKELWEKIDSIADRNVLRCEVVAVCSNGKEIPIDLTMSDVPAETGSARMLILRDATARRRSEQVLRESERRLRQFFESLPYGILVTTGNGSTYYVNRVARQLTAPIDWDGPFNDIVQAMQVYQSGSETQYQPEKLPLFRALAGESGAGDLEMRLNDRVMQLEATWTPIFDAQGRVEYALHAFSDVTHRRQMELQLRQSQKIDALGQLAGGIAHDFNNLLMAMKTFADLLSRRLGTDPKGAKYLGEINKAVDRASWLTAQLLAFGRKQVATRSVVDLNRIVRSLGDMLRGICGETITLTLALKPELGHVNVNEGQMEQVLTNLVLNARDAMPGGGTLTIETANVEIDRGTPGSADLPSGSYVALVVKDSGTGMDENTLVRMFEPFFTTKGHGKGTGLGLSSVHGIVKEHGGTIDVKSTLGVGTSFGVYLPRVDKPLTERKETDEVRDLQGSETILVVENDEAIRESLSEVLRARGYKVLTAGDGLEGARVFTGNAEQIGLVVSDVVMPACGGVEMASEIQKIKPDTEVIFMSGYSDRQIAQENVILLQKPFSPDVLLRRIRDRLNARSEAAGHV